MLISALNKVDNNSNVLSKNTCEIRWIMYMLLEQFEATIMFEKI